MDIDDTDMVWLIHCERAQIYLRHVDRSECRPFIDITNESLADLDPNCALRLLGATSDVRCENDILESSEIVRPGIKIVVEVVSIPARFRRIHIKRCSSNLP